ncbi:LVIVD repeat-containing protein [Haladaptatus halobius]|uniref:LVIVD repeat-containing protein n=1 Tax=Haladaptatus halobius TaxID=2884875 RepID=UPI001D0BD08A|nr:hypothetical protein [Haladaptatus halobius]
MTSSPDPPSRRRVLQLSGSVLAGISLAGCSASPKTDSEEETTTTTTVKERANPNQLSLQKLGQTLPSGKSPPSGGYSETDVRADGRYAVLGTKWGISGSYLVDISDPTSLKQVHYLENSNDAPNLDVKFDHRKGLYYRAIEETWSGNFEIVDYGYDTGTPTNPKVIGSVSKGKSHNVTPHPTKSVLYTVNYDTNTNGFDVYDVTDPTAPRKLGEYGPQGAGHDINVDPEREVLCCAYQAGQFTGLVLYDVSKPRKPVEIGRFDYTKRKPYSEARVGEEAFGAAHHGHFDPRRDLLVIGDERPDGVPGGKHIFDVGWKDGSLKNPIPIGFTISPNARRMENGNYAERLDWTGHHFNIVPWGDATLIVSADWHDGVVLYDITDPTNPHPIDQYPTADGANKMTPNDKVAQLGKPPMAWKAAYNADRELIVASDSFTGLYTFELAAQSQ